jgi:hypothetical protein
LALVVMKLYADEDAVARCERSFTRSRCPLAGTAMPANVLVAEEEGLIDELAIEHPPEH